MYEPEQEPEQEPQATFDPHIYWGSSKKKYAEEQGMTLVQYNARAKLCLAFLNGKVAVSQYIPLTEKIIKDSSVEDIQFALSAYFSAYGESESVPKQGLPYVLYEYSFEPKKLKLVGQLLEKASASFVEDLEMCTKTRCELAKNISWLVDASKGDVPLIIAEAFHYKKMILVGDESIELGSWAGVVNDPALPDESEIETAVVGAPQEEDAVVYSPQQDWVAALAGDASRNKTIDTGALPSISVPSALWKKAEGAEVSVCDSAEASLNQQL